MPPQLMQGLEEGNETFITSGCIIVQLRNRICNRSILDVALWNANSLSSGTVHAYARLGRGVPTANLAAAALGAVSGQFYLDMDPKEG